MAPTTVAARGLSERQRRILSFIRDFKHARGYPPTIREIGQAVGISSTSVVDYNLNALAKAGWVQIDKETSRGIRLAEEDEAAPAGEVLRLPIVGLIAAGAPIEAIAASDPDNHVAVSRDLAEEGSYCLRVKGKSMIEDFIDDGDLAVVRPQETADNGDIVVALITDSPTGEGAATLKRFYREDGRIRLQPANSAMEPIYVRPDEVRIQGRVTAIIRKL